MAKFDNRKLTMKKITIILSILTLIASGCRQATKKTANNELAIEEVANKKTTGKIVSGQNQPVSEKESGYLHPAEDFLKQLMNEGELQLFFSNNWTFVYHKYGRCDGSTDGEKMNLSPFEIDGIIKLNVRNDGDGWACEKKEPTESYLDFRLKEQVKNWNRFEIPNYDNQGKDGVIYIAGLGESDYLVLHYDSNNLIVKMEYRSEDPG
jgi:hypothetical protein